ncbi:hypothetical protein IV54_GL000521 [Levilactobacillus paucivorans]|uniref:Gram-positive cocci surface proteins LPxTG domain-containing protein n=1 Tax=Levilactobacillus paucivorans TaxID=616990 RepID=A0A0R2LMJ6_9LACO|nr:hypothetical protein IV54_GL000521 [Levilactobacillus paucivorans]
MKASLWLTAATVLMGVGMATEPQDVHAAATGQTSSQRATEHIWEWMPNPTLRKIMLKTLNNDPNIKHHWKTEDDITKKDMRLLTKMELTKENVSGVGVQTIQMFSLEGLEYATNLTYLDLDGSVTNFDSTDREAFGKNPIRQPRGHITILSPLMNLTKLDTLILKNNRIDDVRKLANLTNLSYLDLSNCQIADFSPLGQIPFEVFKGEGQVISRTDRFTGNELSGHLKNTSTWIDGSRYEMKALDRYAVPAYTREDRHEDTGDLLGTHDVFKLKFSAGKSHSDGDKGLSYDHLADQEYTRPDDNFTTGEMLKHDARNAMLGEVRSPDGKVLWTYVNTYRFTTYPAPVTVSHVDTDGNKLQDDEVLTGGLGAPYQTQPVKIEGYQHKETKGEMTGKFLREEQKVVHVYEKVDDQDTGTGNGGDGSTGDGDDSQGNMNGGDQGNGNANGGDGQDGSDNNGDSDGDADGNDGQDGSDSNGDSDGDADGNDGQDGQDGFDNNGDSDSDANGGDDQDGSDNNGDSDGDTNGGDGQDGSDSNGDSDGDTNGNDGSDNNGDSDSDSDGNDGQDGSDNNGDSDGDTNGNDGQDGSDNNGDSDSDADGNDGQDGSDNNGDSNGDVNGNKPGDNNGNGGTVTGPGTGGNGSGNNGSDNGSEEGSGSGSGDGSGTGSGSGSDGNDSDDGNDNNNNDGNGSGTGDGNGSGTGDGNNTGNGGDTGTDNGTDTGTGNENDTGTGNGTDTSDGNENDTGTGSETGSTGNTGGSTTDTGSGNQSGTGQGSQSVATDDEEEIDSPVSGSEFDHATTGDGDNGSTDLSYSALGGGSGSTTGRLPQTGEAQSSWTWLGLLLVSLFGTGFMKHKRREE